MPHSPTAIPLPQARRIVRALYRGLLGREPDPAGLRYWSDLVTQHGSAGAVLDAIVAGGEFQDIGARHADGAALWQTLAPAAAAALAGVPLQIVDVGAQELEGEQHVYAPLCRPDLPHHVIGFEPLADKIRESAARHAGKPLTLLPTFIGDGASHTFHINNDDATSSLLPLNEALTSLLADLSHLHTVRRETVTTSTLDQALAGTARVDFLKLDIQGFEGRALEHAGAVLGRTNVVHCEVSFAEIYQGQALFAEVDTLLRAHGFEFIDLSSACRYAYHGEANSSARDRLGWGDAVYFKRAELVAEARDLAAQMAVALLVYDKPSLAEFLAARHDARAGGALAGAFSAAVTGAAAA
ncbi:MAG: FkbM family methyltransferase [Pseudomonadota bacterium]